MSFQDLPAEVRTIIIPLCSPGTLAALSRVEKSISFESNKELYRVVDVKHLRHRDQPEPTQSPISTLSQNKDKAAMVEFLSLHYFDSSWANDERDDISKERFITAFRNMISLVDLRIHLPGQTGLTPLHARLSEVIGAGTFRLRALCCPDTIDLATVVRGQPGLNFLGLYPVLMKFRNVIFSQQFSLVISTIRATLVSEATSIFLARLKFWHPDQFPVHPALKYPSSMEIDLEGVRSGTLQSILKTAFDTDSRRALVLDSDKIIRLVVKLSQLDAEQLEKAREMLSAGSALFTCFVHLVLMLDNHRSSDTAVLRELLALVPELETFELQATNYIQLSPPDCEAYARLWGATCPKLRLVILPGSPAVVQKVADSVWKVTTS